jgi:hypothetical protein
MLIPFQHFCSRQVGGAREVRRREQNGQHPPMVGAVRGPDRGRVHQARLHETARTSAALPLQY